MSCNHTDVGGKHKLTMFLIKLNYKSIIESIIKQTLLKMVDHNAAANKQIDSMTDKQAERTVAGAGAAVANLQTEESKDQSAYIVPSKQDMEVLQKNFKASRFEVIDSYTKAEGDFGNTVRNLLRTF